MNIIYIYVYTFDVYIMEVSMIVFELSSMLCALVQFQKGKVQSE